MSLNVSDCFNDSENSDCGYDTDQYEVDYETTFCGYDVVMLKDKNPIREVIEIGTDGRCFSLSKGYYESPY